MSSGSGEVLFAGLGERRVDLAGDVAFQAADDLALALAFAGAADDVVLGRLVVAHADEHDPVEGRVGLPVAASVWLSQLACTGRWTRIRLRQWPWSRSIDLAPRWEEPLSTIQKTRRAEA